MIVVIMIIILIVVGNIKDIVSVKIISANNSIQQPSLTTAELIVNNTSVEKETSYRLYSHNNCPNAPKQYYMSQYEIENTQADK